MKHENISLPSKVYFPNLDGLRTVAFLLVFVQHGLWSCFDKLSINSDLANRFIYGIANGATGVSIFFVLSGFLITYLLLHEIELRGKLNIGHFYMRRVLRIWPLYYAVIIFALVVYPFLKSLLHIDSHLASRPFYYFTFLSNFDVINIQKFHPGADAMMQNVTWSVAVEEQFYLVWPLFFFFLPKKFHKFIFPVIIAICLIFRFLNRNNGSVLYFHSLSVCADLAVGGICAYYTVYSKKFKHFLQNINKPIIMLIYITGLIWMLYGGTLMNEFTNPLLTRLITSFFFAFCILEQNFSKNSFYKFSENKSLTFWGKYTYGLYLLHPIAILIFDIALRTLDISYKNSLWSLLSIGIGSLLLSMIMSYLSYEFYESRFLKLKSRFSIIHSNNIRIKTKLTEQKKELTTL